MERVQDFERQLERAMAHVRTILETTRNPQFASDVPHSYEDKYFLAEYLTNSALAAMSRVLERLGLTPELLAKAIEWSKSGRSVSLQLRAQQACKFVKKTARKVDSDTEHVSTTRVLGITATTSSKVVTTVVEWFWDLSANYELAIYCGTDVAGGLVLRGGQGTLQLCTTTEQQPSPDSTIFPAIDVNITWLLQQINEHGQFAFGIDRGSDQCRTPRRNPEVHTAVNFFALFRAWFNNVNNFFHSQQFSRQPQHSLQMGAISSGGIFVPILPLFEEEPAVNASSSSSSSSSLVSLAPSTCRGLVLPVADVCRFLAEHERSIDAKLADLARLFPRDGQLITEPDVHVCALAQHGSHLSSVFIDGVNYIEGMLYKQLHAAIGKEVSPADFADYMSFHNRKLFREQFEPSPFCHAVRRPDHYPEGVVSIEAVTNELPQPILTSSRSVQPVHPMTFALSAATNVTFRGERFIHSWINHSFAGSSGLTLSLNARARQFSCFILLVGRVASATVFEPTGAIIVQNKDDLAIPLMLEQIPTPKEFQDAIDSLSPEQQRFAKAYREMQLASTLFGICVVQIKPQLEKLLNLPADALTKEIRLTQDLLELFIKYQIPSDLLSYDGADGAPLAAKVSKVSDYVAAVRQTIADMKTTELEEAKLKAVSRTLIPDDPCPQPSFPMPPSSSSSSSSWSAPILSCSSSLPVSTTTTTTTSTSIRADRSSSTAAGAKPKASQPVVVKKGGSASVDAGGVFDYSAIPTLLDREFARLDVDSALRPTIIKPQKTWIRKRQATLLSAVQSSVLSKEQRRAEKNQAFDLLDALSRSGSLPLDDVAFHVVLAATHCFTDNVTNTVVVHNVNPIEKVERSLLIVAQTIHDRPAAELIKPDQLARVQAASPVLFQ